LKILVTEHSDHFFLLGHLDKVLSSAHEVEYIFRLVRNQQYWKSIFITKRKVSVCHQSSRFVRELHFFGYIFFRGFRVDKIIINTGPEYESARIIFLSLLAYLPHKRKLINTIRNPSQLSPGPQNKKMNRILRRVLVTKSRSLIFENGAAERETVNLIPRVVNKSRCILYTYFFENPTDFPNGIKNGNQFVIGILGTINPLRRDYEILLSCIILLKSKGFKEIQLVFLGSSFDSSSSAIIEDFRELVAVRAFVDGWLSDETFVEWGQGCDVLLAPLKFGLKQYGSGGSTGSFGDAIRLRKRLLIPEFADPLKEFSTFCDYYTDKDSLYAALLDHLENPNGLEITEEIVEKFGREKVVQSLEFLFAE